MVPFSLRRHLSDALMPSLSQMSETPVKRLSTGAWPLASPTARFPSSVLMPNRASEP